MIELNTHPNTDTLSLGDFIDYVSANVKPEDPESIAKAAPLLQALANDKTLLSKHIHESLTRTPFYRDGAIYTPNLFLLKRFGKFGCFMVRMIAWQEEGDVQNPQDVAYHLGHDHSFNLLTCNYHGPGYDSSFYTYNPDEEFYGYVGEHVPSIKYVGEQRLSPGKTLLIEANRDIHTQYAPERLSVSLNLVCFLDDPNALRYHFNLQEKTVIRVINDMMFPQLCLLKIAPYLFDENTIDLVDNLSRMHRCRMTRALCYKTLMEINQENQDYFFQRAVADDPRYAAYFEHYIEQVRSDSNKGPTTPV